MNNNNNENQTILNNIEAKNHTLINSNSSTSTSTSTGNNGNYGGAVLIVDNN